MSLKRTWRAIRHWLYRVFGIQKGGTSVDGGSSSGKDSGPTPPALNWCWGGFNGSKAKESDRARIRNLRVTADGLSYGWERGGCEDLGATSSGDCDHTVACLFLDDGRGGKFEWISTSRRTRSFNNIKDGYHGWDAKAFRSAKRVWFCICSSDGKRRTNLISAERSA